MTPATARTLDVSGLAPGAFRHRSLMWWGTVGMLLIEGTMFGLSIGMYFYLRTRSATWPPNLPPPDLTWGTVNTALLVISLVPNMLTKWAGERIDLAAVRRWLVVTVVLGVVINVVRLVEFSALNCRWDTNAYGSIVWFLVGMHTVHVSTDVVDSLVLLVLMFVGPIDERRFVDVQENSVYWNFVALVWLPIYGVIYWAPRLI